MTALNPTEPSPLRANPHWTIMDLWRRTGVQTWENRVCSNPKFLGSWSLKTAGTISIYMGILFTFLSSLETPLSHWQNIFSLTEKKGARLFGSKWGGFTQPSFKCKALAAARELGLQLLHQPDTSSKIALSHLPDPISDPGGGLPRSPTYRFPLLQVQWPNANTIPCYDITALTDRVSPC